MKRPIILWLLCLALCVPVTAASQTDTSYRIRSLGVHFRGILDDYLTDIFLNPATTSKLDGRMIYGYQIPSRNITVPYPTEYRANFGEAPLEDRFYSYTVQPLALTYVHSRPGGAALSIGVEAYVSTRDDFDARRDAGYYVSDSRLETVAQESGRAWETQHYVLDLAFATAPNATNLGVRIRGSYDRDENQDADGRTTHQQKLGGGRDEELRWSTDREESEHERVALLVEAGLHRPDKTFRDIVLSGEVFSDQLNFLRRELQIVNQDLDGNGQDISGHTPDNRFDESYVSSNRKYTGFGVSGWLTLDWPGDLRSTYRASWRRSTGDGSADYLSDHQRYGTLETLQKSGVLYGYDGVVDDLFFDTSVGAGTMIVDDVLVAIAVYGAYSRVDFEEDGLGDASLSYGGRDSAIDTAFASPYLQRHNNTAETFGLWIPAGIEWQFHRFAKLRVGLTFSATRTDTDRLVDREVSVLNTALPVPNADGRSGVRDVVITTSAAAAYNNGLEININDRFVMDLLYTATYGSRVNLASYAYVSARYQF